MLNLSCVDLAFAICHGDVSCLMQGHGHRPAPPRPVMRPPIPAAAKMNDSSLFSVPDFKAPAVREFEDKGDVSEEEELTCCICLEWPPEIVLQPCGHNNMCENCAYSVKNLNEGLCPECRCRIEAIIKPL